MPLSPTPLAGRLAFVTGSSRGIGRAVALELASWGADVVVHALKNLDLAEEVAAEIRGMGRRSLALLADVKDRQAMEQAAGRIKAELGTVDILVNNAGTRKDGHFILMGQASWDEVLGVNLFGTIHATQVCVRGMMAQKWGRIINILTPTAFVGQPGQTNYGASKGAVWSLTMCLAREMAPFGVLVHAVSPGLIETELTADIPEERKKLLLEPTVLKRVGQPEEVARVVAFLASDLATYMSGQVIHVDGGLCR